jgi:hypothetical protein
VSELLRAVVDWAQGSPTDRVQYGVQAGHVHVDSDFERHASLGMKYLERCSFQQHARVSGEWKTNRAGKGFSVRGKDSPYVTLEP